MGGLLQVLGLRAKGGPGVTAPVDVDGAKAAYESAKQALEDGDLKKVPDKAPPGVEAAHAAVHAARKALPAAPKSASDYVAAQKALDLLKRRVADYLAAEAAVLKQLKAKLDTARTALGPQLASLPAGAPKGLEKPYAAVDAARKAVADDPKSIEDYVAALKGLPALKKATEDYLKAEAKKKRVDAGIGLYGAGGSKSRELTGYEKLNDEQQRMLDKALSDRIGESSGEIAEKDLKKIAQRIVEKTNKLAETPLEKKIPGINEKLAKSETLKTNIVKLQAAKWNIKVNKPGGGSYCDKVNKTIAIDPNDPIEEALGGLAHETGHALYTPPPKPTVKDSASGIDYVRRCTEVDFLDEGEAQLVACRAATDLKAKGEKANVPADSGVFMDTYTKYATGQLTEDAARKDMAKAFGNLVTSTTHESYLIYYGRGHIASWNAAHKKEPAKQLDESVLTTMTLFP
jgi:type VI secretion system secreted protein VgrG